LKEDRRNDACAVLNAQEAVQIAHRSTPDLKSRRQKKKQDTLAVIYFSSRHQVACVMQHIRIIDLGKKTSSVLC
jgi:hypothetical protein